MRLRSWPEKQAVEQLAAPETINTMPEKTLLAFVDHGQTRQALTMAGDTGTALIAECRVEGVDEDALAARLQREGADAFAASWRKLLESIASKASKLADGGTA